MTIKPTHDLASPTQVESLLSRLEDWLRQVRESQIKSRLHLKTPPPNAQAIGADVRNLGLRRELTTVESVEEVISAVKQWLKQAPVVHLTFSAAVLASTRRTIVDWLRSQIDPSILVEFKVDSAITSGFLLRTKNQVHDFTGNRVLWQNRAKIGELVRRV